MFKDNKRLVLCSIFIIFVVFFSIIGYDLLFNNRYQFSDNANSARIQIASTLNIPKDKQDEVLSYIKYLINQKRIINIYPELELKGNSFIEEDIFIDNYFDTPNLDLLRLLNGVRYRKRLNLRNPNEKKNRRELIQIKINTSLNITQQRQEIKFKIDNIRNQKEKHPLTMFLKTKDAKDFKNIILSLNINPDYLKPFITIKQRRRRLYINGLNRTIFSFSVDEYSSQKYWAYTKIIVLDFGIDEISYTEADDKTRDKMRRIHFIILNDLKNHFTYLKEDNRPKYNVIFDKLSKQIPFLSYLTKFSL